MTISREEQHRPSSPLEQLSTSTLFLVRKFADRVTRELVKGGNVVEDVGSTIERSRAAGEDIVTRIGELLAKHPTGEDKELTTDITDKHHTDDLIDLRHNTVVDLREPHSPEQEAELQEAIDRHPASRTQ